MSGVGLHVMSEVIKQTDSAVAKFTRSILDVARKNHVDFAYAGRGHSKPAEILRVMKINNRAIHDLLKKK